MREMFAMAVLLLACVGRTSRSDDTGERGHLWRVLDEDAGRSATFGSVNNKIVAVGRRWFVVYRLDSSGDVAEGCFRLVMSEDAGRTWILAKDDIP
ncbi:MAG: hypothetical protein FJ272_22835 [Planctomycetes bacterium]|nr:hypothetical protein [Planctomycetota bacterium]